VNTASGSTAERARPGELMRLVASGLTRNGFDIHPPECEDGGRLLIGCQGARCALAVNDWGFAEWECHPQADCVPDPKQIADLVTTLLTGGAGDYPRQGDGYDCAGITLKGIVGRELQARGLEVELEVAEDAMFFNAYAEVVATSPGTGEGAEVRVSDDGSVTWERDYAGDAAVLTGEPGYTGCRTDPAAVAGGIVAVVTQVLSQGLPGAQVTRTTQPAPGAAAQRHGNPGTQAAQDCLDDVTDLEKLASELDALGCTAQLLTPAGKLPYLGIADPPATMPCDRVYAQAGTFFWHGAQVIAPSNQAAAAAAIITQVLCTAPPDQR
jgi:hypothetical protein